MAKFSSSFGLVAFLCVAKYVEYSVGASMGFPGIPVNSNFGPYYIVSRSVTNSCSLSGSKDANNDITNTFAIYKVDRIREVLRGNVIVPYDVTNIATSVSTEIWRDGGFKPFFYKMYKKPCEEGAVAYFLNTFFDADKSCNVKRANYTIDNINPNDMMKDVIGNNFFYEKMSVTMAWYSKKRIIGCVVINCESKPLPKKSQRSRYNNRTTT